MTALGWLVAILVLAALARSLRPARLTPPENAGPWRLVRHRFLLSAGARTALAFLLGLALVAVLARWLAPYPPNELLGTDTLSSLPPSLQHPFGTDQASRDLFSRVLYGARVSLSIALLAIVIAATVGTLYGAIAGYYGGRLDGTMMRAVDGARSIPRVILLLAILSLWGALSIPALVLLLGFTGWFGVSRLVRAEVLSLRQRDMVVAARALGAGDWRILTGYVIPNVLSPVIVAAALGIGELLVLEAGLSYFGIGVRPPDPSWGTIMADGRGSIAALWWVSLFPGLAIVFTVMAFTIVADRLRTALDPRQLPTG